MGRPCGRPGYPRLSTYQWLGQPGSACSPGLTLAGGVCFDGDPTTMHSLALLPAEYKDTLDFMLRKTRLNQGRWVSDLASASASSSFHSTTVYHEPSRELDGHSQMSSCSRQGFRMSDCRRRRRRNGREHWRLCHGARNDLVDIMRLTSRSMAYLRPSASGAAIASRTLRGSGNGESCMPSGGPAENAIGG